jgi:hypothetical protein
LARARRLGRFLNLSDLVGHLAEWQRWLKGASAQRGKARPDDGRERTGLRRVSRARRTLEDES